MCKRERKSLQYTYIQLIFFKNFILDWGSLNLYLENHTMFPKKSTAGVQNGLKFKIDPAKAVM